MDRMEAAWERSTKEFLPSIEAEEMNVLAGTAVAGLDDGGGGVPRRVGRRRRRCPSSGRKRKVGAESSSLTWERDKGDMYEWAELFNRWHIRFADPRSTVEIK
jgi:hypothetical protein